MKKCKFSDHKMHQFRRFHCGLPAAVNLIAIRMISQQVEYLFDYLWCHPNVDESHCRAVHGSLLGWALLPRVIDTDHSAKSLHSRDNHLDRTIRSDHTQTDRQRRWHSTPVARNTQFSCCHVEKRTWAEVYLRTEQMPASSNIRQCKLHCMYSSDNIER